MFLMSQSMICLLPHNTILKFNPIKSSAYTHALCSVLVRHSMCSMTPHTFFPATCESHQAVTTQLSGMVIWESSCYSDPTMLQHAQKAFKRQLDRLEHCRYTQWSSQTLGTFYAGSSVIDLILSQCMYRKEGILLHVHRSCCYNLNIGSKFPQKGTLPLRCTPKYYGKDHGSLLSGWMIHNYTGLMLLAYYIQQYSIVDHNSVEGGLNVIDCIVLSAEYWCFNCIL